MAYTSLDKICRSFLLGRGYSIHYYLQCLLYARDCLRELHFDDAKCVSYKVLTPNAAQEIPLPEDCLDVISVGESPCWENDYCVIGCMLKIKNPCYYNVPVIVTYLSDGTCCDTATHVDPYAIATITAYIEWGMDEKLKAGTAGHMKFNKARQTYRGRKSDLTLDDVQRIVWEGNGFYRTYPVTCSTSSAPLFAAPAPVNQQPALPPVIIQTGGGGSGVPHSVAFTSQSSVTVNHTLGYRPNVWVLDEQGNLISESIQHTSNTQFIVSFGDPTSGTVYYQ